MMKHFVLLRFIIELNNIRKCYYTRRYHYDENWSLHRWEDCWRNEHLGWKRISEADNYCWWGSETFTYCYTRTRWLSCLRISVGGCHHSGLCFSRWLHSYPAYLLVSFRLKKEISFSLVRVSFLFQMFLKLL